MDEEEVDYLNQKNQLRIIKKLLEEPKLFVDVHEVIEPKDFDDLIHQQVMKMSSEYYMKNSRPPNIFELEAYNDSESHDATYKTKEIAVLIEELKTVDVSEIQNVDFWKSSILDFAKKSRTVKMLYEGVDWLDTNSSSEKDYQYFASKMSSISNLTLEETKIHDYFENAEERFKYFGNFEERRIKSDIQLLNQIGFGDIEALSLFLGETNIGKCFAPETTITIYVEPSDYDTYPEIRSLELL